MYQHCHIIPNNTFQNETRGSSFADISDFRLDTNSTALALSIEQSTRENTAQPSAATRQQKK
jgi:hypothetical protein